MIDFKALAAPFPPDVIDWRVGSTTQDKKRGMALAYLDARDVMNRLDEICTPAGWQCRYSHANGKTVCDIAVRCTDDWVWKADGAGDTDFEAEKGALSSAFKRAAVRWGVGRYLYDLPAPWVAIQPMGKSYKIADSEMAKLKDLLANLPAKPAPKNSRDPKWRGPMIKGDLSKAVAKIKESLKTAQTDDDLMATWREHHEVISQCQHDAPDLFSNTDADQPGMKQIAEMIRAQINQENERQSAYGLPDPENPGSYLDA